MESMAEPMNDGCLKNISENPLSDSWTFWAHLPHDIDWSVGSYKNIFTIKTVEESLLLFENFPDILISNCMLFLMRTGCGTVVIDI